MMLAVVMAAMEGGDILLDRLNGKQIERLILNLAGNNGSVPFCVTPKKFDLDVVMNYYNTMTRSRINVVKSKTSKRKVFPSMSSLIQSHHLCCIFYDNAQISGNDGYVSIGSDIHQ